MRVSQPQRHRVEAADRGRLGDEFGPWNRGVVRWDLDGDEFDRETVWIVKRQDGLAEPLDAILVVDTVVVEPLFPVPSASAKKK